MSSTAQPDPTAALTALRSGIHRSGQLRVQDANKIEVKIQNMGRKFIFALEKNGSPGFNGFSAAFVKYLAQEYPDIVCNPLAKNSMAVRVNDVTVSFETSALNKTKKLIDVCQQAFLIVPLLVREDGIMESVLTPTQLKQYIGNGSAEPKSSGRIFSHYAHFAFVQLRGKADPGHTIEYFSPMSNASGYENMANLVGSALSRQFGAVPRPIPASVCPRSNENAPNTSLWCALWTLYYFLMRATHPDDTTEGLVNDIAMSVDVRYGSANADFLNFLKAFYTYFSTLTQDKLFAVPTFNEASAKALMEQQLRILNYFVSLGEREFMFSFFEMVSKFPMCFLARSVPSRDEIGCFIVDRDGDLGPREGDEFVQWVRHSIANLKNADCQIIFVIFQIRLNRVPTAATRNANNAVSFFAYDRSYNLLYTTNSYAIAKNPKCEGDDVVQPAVKVVPQGQEAGEADAAPVLRTRSKCVYTAKLDNLGRTATKMLNLEVARPYDIRSRNVIGPESDEYPTEYDVWPDLKLHTDDYAQERIDVGKVASLLIDTFFWFFLRVSDRENNLLVVHRSNAPVQEKIARLSFNMRFLEALRAHTAGTSRLASGTQIITSA